MKRKNTRAPEKTSELKLQMYKQKMLALHIGDETILSVFPVEHSNLKEENKCDVLAISITGYSDGGLEFCWPEVIENSSVKNKS